MHLTNAEKRDLKARAAFLQSLDEALGRHGLVKMKFGDFKEERKTLAPKIAAETRSELVMQVGNVAVFFRPKTEPAEPPADPEHSRRESGRKNF
jgi:RNA-binding protein